MTVELIVGDTYPLLDGGFEMLYIWYFLTLVNGVDPNLN